ncbi:protein FAM24A [Orycteropus afer afer]|uniref:Protein FAM24A n=1 Tax=Orycteropus afer afer TaxID=1230840 RepID=A0AC54Z110_ORYAF|nr:protein FAM24A [Orycteropus afer afer]
MGAHGGASKMLDRKTMITVVVGGCLLITALVLTGVLVSLYFKAAKAKKPAKKTCLAVPLKKKNLATNTQEASVTPVPSATLQVCEECSMYVAYDPLPPCFCDTNEGL